jgi:hypothetical protein
MRLGMVGPQFQVPAIAGDRLIRLPLLQQDVAQVVVCPGIVRIPLQCPAATVCRLIEPPLVLEDHAQIVVRLGVIRLDRQDLPVDLLGQLQPAGLVMLNGDCPRFGNGCHTAIIEWPTGRV